jgi:protein TonB
VSERESIAQSISLPLALLISLGVHLLFFRGQAFWKTTAPQPLFQQGRTTVELTLLPSRASEATPETPPTPSIPPAPEKLKPLVQQRQPAPVVLPTSLPPKKETPPLEKKASKPRPAEDPIMEVAPQKTPTEKPIQKNSVASQEQDATKIKEKGVGTQASVLRATAPSYPRLSRRLGEEGTVWIRVWVSAKGKLEKAEVKKSSGFRRLDAAALKAVRKTRFAPAQKSGHAVAAEIDLPFCFKLTEQERRKR